MAHCPRCHHEFQDWVKTCPDCGSCLVSALPVPEAVGRDEGHEPLVHIATASDEVLASMWKEVLEDEGIRCMVKRDDLAAATFALTWNTQCEIHVLASDAEKTKEILDSLREDSQPYEDHENP
jgi:hypothetical protein